jgi:hypothetical protein
MVYHHDDGHTPSKPKRRTLSGGTSSTDSVNSNDGDINFGDPITENRGWKLAADEHDVALKNIQKSTPAEPPRSPMIHRAASRPSTGLATTLNS